VGEIAARPKVAAGCYENGSAGPLRLSSGCPANTLALHPVSCPDNVVRCRPLVQRLDSVKEILHKPSVAIEKLKGLLTNQPDMQRGLSRIQYGKVRRRHDIYFNVTH
jgi:hypothetical protein